LQEPFLKNPVILY